MASKKNNITTSFSADVKDLKAGIQDAKAAIKLASAEFKAASTAADYAADSAEGYQTKITQLSKVLDAQETILNSYKKQLELVEKEQGANSSEAIKLKTAIANQQAVVNTTANELKKYEDKLNGAADGAEELAESTEDANKAAKDADGGFSTFKATLADLAATAIKAVVSGLKDIGKAATEAWKEWDEGADNIIKATGATGEQADELTQSLSNVSKRVVGDFGKLGSTIGEINTRFGFTGTALEDATVAFTQFSEITGQDAVSAVQEVSKAMEGAGVDASQYATLLDQIAAAAQASGISTSKIGEGLTKYGASMRAAGFSLEDTIAIMAQFEKAGVNSESAIGGIVKAAGTWSKSGEDPAAALQSYIKAIQGAGTETEASQKAIEAFGTKAGVELADVIRSGRMDFTAFSQTVKNAGGTVQKTFEATQDAPDRLALAMQGLKVEAAGVVQELMTEFEPEITSIIEGLGDIAHELIPAISTFLQWIIDNGPAILSVLTGIGTAFLAFKIVGLITSLYTAFTTLFAALKAGQGIMAALNITMSANPIGLIITLIAGLVAAFATLWATSEDFRNFWINLFDAIGEKVSSFVEAVKAGLGILGKFLGNVFKKPLEGIKAGFSALVNVVKLPINALIKGINLFLSGLNTLKIPDWVPGVGGLGFHVPLIPELAEGGILKKGQLGLLEGNGAEAVVPLDQNRKWIAAVAAEMRNAATAGGEGAQGAGATYTYNQYNNSPKALSRLEIYRQTQNLLAFGG